MPKMTGFSEALGDLEKANAEIKEANATIERGNADMRNPNTTADQLQQLSDMNQLAYDRAQTARAIADEAYAETQKPLKPHEPYKNCDDIMDYNALILAWFFLAPMSGAAIAWFNYYQRSGKLFPFRSGLAEQDGQTT